MFQSQLPSAPANSSTGIPDAQMVISPPSAAHPESSPAQGDAVATSAPREGEVACPPPRGREKGVSRGRADFLGVFQFGHVLLGVAL